MSNSDADDDDDEGSNDTTNDATTPPKKKLTRWDRLNPKVKERIVKEAHARAIANKKKREPAKDKKRSAFHV